MENTQVSLLDRIRSGDPHSWREADELYRPLIFQWLRRFGFQSNDVDDLTQDVMVTLAREIRTFEHRGHLGAFRGWLRTITVNRARLFARRNKRRPAPKGGTEFKLMLDQLTDDDSALSQQFDRSHDVHVISAALDQLSTEIASTSIQAFRMHVMEGRRPQEVADAIGITRWSVYKAKSRVLRKLRDKLGDWTDDLRSE